MKERIPAAVREQVWLLYMGERYQGKCVVDWCENIINVFSFQSGHNIPESKGGSTTIDNLRPICARCNLSMSNNYTIDEWNKFGKKKEKRSPYFSCCLPPSDTMNEWTKYKFDKK